MDTYDIIVIGSGAGNIIAAKAVRDGLHTALIDKGPLGGTCLNLGCIPSKLLIAPADRIMQIREARNMGVHAKILEIDFGGIMRHMRRSVEEDRHDMRRGFDDLPGLDLFQAKAAFVDDCLVSVSGRELRGDKIFIASGARPRIPSIEGLEKVPYLTNETVLELKTLPESIIIVGGGYVAAEYAHFFSAMGSNVTVLQRGLRMVRNEEPAISALLESRMKKRMQIHTQMDVIKVMEMGNTCQVTARGTVSGKTKEFCAEKLMLAAGRTSNADLLAVDRSGIETDENNYIIVDDFLETNHPNIYALGDAIGRQMFRHAANHEAQIAWHNAMGGEKTAMNFGNVPHAVFSHPQIASVGMTENAAYSMDERILVGTAHYKDIAKGEAMHQKYGFAKLIAHRESGQILGCHIIGPHAAVLLQEVVNIMTAGGTVMHIIEAMHIHPALSELIQDAVGNLQPVEAPL